MRIHQTNNNIDQGLTLIVKWWQGIIFCVAGLIQVLAIIRALLRPGLPALAHDAAFFQHAGWYLNQGAIPYLNMWDPVPPLLFEISAILAFFSQDNMFRLHILSIIATTAAAIGSAILVTLLTYELTQSKIAAIVAVLTLYTFPAYYILPTLGFSTKHLVIFFGLLAIYLALHENPFWSGLSGALSMGLWLLGAIFTVLALLILWQKEAPKMILKFFMGLCGAIFIIILPILAWGAFFPMIEQVFLVHLLVPERSNDY